MLTLSTIKNSSGAAKYYAKEDNYYLAEADAKEASMWWGKGAAELEVRGKVAEKDLQKLFEGKLPNGTVVGLQKDGTINHRAGFDICFHAPKSVSILALAEDDKRFYTAHLESVKEALKIIERDCAQAKLFKNKKINFENTKNLAVALIRHAASRELDPHLHHHALIMNVTKRSDNAWRSLASSTAKTDNQVNGFFERIYNNQIYYGLIYKSSLANKVQNLGCEIEVVGKHGMWEIKGIPKEAREIMSKRRKQIEERIENLNYRSLKAADIASLDTREKKSKNIKLEEIRQIWKDELSSIGFSPKDFITDLGTNRKNKDEILLSNTKNIENGMLATKEAIEHLSQYKLKLDYSKIIAQALEFSVGKTSHRDIVFAVDQIIKDGALIPLDKSASIFVTQNLIDTEKTIMEHVDKSKDAGFSVKLKNTYIGDATTENGLAKKVLQSKNRLSLVRSGNTDNTNFLSAILKLGEASGKTVRVLAPNRLIANDFNENIRRKPNGIWQWLVSLGKPEIGETVAGFKYRYREELALPSFLLRFKQGKEIIAVNNSEVLGCGDIRSLLELTDKSKAKVIFLQDTSSKIGFGAGNPVTTIEQAGIETFEFRDKENNENKKSNVTLELKSTPNDSERLEQLAKEYARGGEKERSETLVLVGSKKQLTATNIAIREELKLAGILSGVEHNISVLNSVYLSKQEAALAHKYQNNMVVRFYGGQIPIDWSIESHNRDTNKLRLVRNKRRILWDPRKNENCAVFKKEILKLAKGEQLIATSNIYNLGIKNGAKFKVTGIDEKYIELIDIKSRSGKILRFKMANLKNTHFSYDYATTLSKASNKQVSHILADFKAYSLDQATAKELAKRASESLTIFTNDAAVAQKRFGHVPVKATTIDTLLNTAQITKNSIDRIISDMTVYEIKIDIEKAVTVLKNQYDLKEQAERKAVEFALDKITSRNAGFTHKELVQEALEYAIKEQMAVQNQKVTRKDIEKAIMEKRTSGELLMGKYFDDGTRWTTREMLELEKKIISGMKNGINKLAPLLDSETVKNALNQTKFTAGQKNSCHLIATTKDQYTIVQGYAGTGKTSMFLEVQKMLGKSKIIGLAPTHRAVRELSSKGIDAQTLQSFIIEQKLEQEKYNGRANKEIESLNNKLIILDEASMVSNNEMVQFIEISDQAKAHVVLSGDIAQHVAIGSGKPLEMVQKSGILKIAYLKEIVRQKNPNLKGAVKNIIDGNYSHAFTKIEQENPKLHIARIEAEHASLKKEHSPLSPEFFKNIQKSIIEIDNNNLKPGEKTLEQMAAKDYLTRTPEARKQTVVIVHANDDRKVINDLIRDGLKKQGMIEQKGTLINCLTAKGLTTSEHKLLQSYQINDVLRFGKKYYHVIEKEQETKSLLLRDETSKTKYFYPKKDADKHNVELYSHATKELAVGDVIRLTKTDKKRTLYANFEYIVKEINDKQVSLDPKDLGSKQHKSLILNHRELRDSHWDYAQTVTGYGIQSGSEKYVIDFEVSYRKHLANQRSFYIGASRAIEHLIIYTDNKERLLKRIIGNKGDKYAAVEVIRDITSQNDPAHHREELAKQEPAPACFHPGWRSKNIWITSSNLNHYDAKEINRLVTCSAESIVDRLLGSPNKKLSSSTEWRYGNKGSLVISMSGDKRGLWHNFETGESGNLITLLQKEIGLNFSETLQSVSSFLPTFQYGSLKSKSHRNDGAKLKQDRTTDYVHSKTYEKNKTSKYAEKLVSESAPIAGTIVEQYLKNRNINYTDTTDIRYHPKVHTGADEKQKYLPAMLAVGSDIDGSVRCVQATYLDPKTANKADISIKKRTYGSLSGALVSLENKPIPRHRNEENILTRHREELAERATWRPRNPWIAAQNAAHFARNDRKKNKMTFIAEGVETGLSIRDALDAGGIKNSEVLVTLGKSNLANINPERIGDKVVFCLDNDGPKTFTDAIIHKAAEQLISAHKDVFITLPQQLNDKNAKIDFNDLARSAGIDAVKNTLDNSISYNEWKNNPINIEANRDIEITPRVCKKVLQEDYHINNELHNLLFKEPKIDLDAAIKLVDFDQKDTAEKYITSYCKAQNDLQLPDKSDITKNISVEDTQKIVSDTEREIC